MCEAVLQRITVAPKGSFFLFGARGVGKSTWARETFPGAHRFDLLDEGQRIPGLLNEVHRAIEEPHPLQSPRAAGIAWARQDRRDGPVRWHDPAG